jgi:hypothetical protein
MNMNERAQRLGYAWSHPVETFRHNLINKVAMFNTVIFGGVEAVSTTGFALGEVKPLNFALTSAVFLGAVANASCILVQNTELPNFPEEQPTS